MNVKITGNRSINGVFSVPGDKSISHRAVMLAALTEGKTQIEGFLAGDDCISTINCFRELGIKIELNGEKVTVHGKGLYGLSKPNKPLDVGNSGTTIRLLSGILAAQPFETVITGDQSIQKRPMERIIEPLIHMGAEIESKNGKAPLLIKGNPKIKSINYTSKIASAQVKSCILLAGLYADGETTVTEPIKSRNHTELMLRYLRGNIKTIGTSVTVIGKKPLQSLPIYICGDISSAAFLISAAIITDNSEIIVTNVGVNLTRIGIITALREMGAEIDVLNKRIMCGEYVADIKAKSSNLLGTTVGGNIIPSLIDEIPILSVASLFAQGRTVIKDAEELKVKESNRIEALSTELKKMGANIQGTNDGLIIEGGNQLKGAAVNSRNDHRLAMSLAVAALNSEGETIIENSECVNVSFPGFYNIFNLT